MKKQDKPITFTESKSCPGIFTVPYEALVYDLNIGRASVRDKIDHTYYSLVDAARIAATEQLIYNDQDRRAFVRNARARGIII